MENDKFFKLYDLNNNQFCLFNQNIEFFKDNIWQYLNKNFSKSKSQDLFLNFFDYNDINILRPLQYFYQDKYKNLKDDDYIVYYNNKYYHKTNYINLILNTLTFYLLNYEQNKVSLFINIIKNNIVYSKIRKFDKHKDFSLKYKNFFNKETLDKIYFNKQLFKDLLKLKLNISFKFKNINCIPNILNISIYKNMCIYNLEDNINIYLFLINNVLNIKSIELKEKVNEKSNINLNKNIINDFNGSVFIENVIIDFNYDNSLFINDDIKENIKDNLTIKNDKIDENELKNIEDLDDIDKSKNKINKHKSLNLTELLGIITTNSDLNYDDINNDINDDITDDKEIIKDLKDDDKKDNEDENTKKEQIYSKDTKYNHKYSDTSYEDDEKTNDINEIDDNLYNDDIKHFDKNNSFKISELNNLNKKINNIDEENNYKEELLNKMNDLQNRINEINEILTKII